MRVEAEIRALSDVVLSESQKRKTIKIIITRIGERKGWQAFYNSLKLVK